MNVLAHAEPAGGAPLKDVVIASGVAVIALALLAVFTVVFRRGGMSWLRRVSRFAERLTGFPAWAIVPVTVTSVSAIVAAFGFYWDVSTHIDNGRDAGPFANPSHFFILFGLVGIALAGYLSGLLAQEEDGPKNGVRVLGWTFPTAGLLLLVCGVIALAGFPLDDVWHRLFGQDVTLWGPTHVQMVGGASLSTLGMWMLIREAAPHRKQGIDPAWFKHREIGLAGAFLIGLSTLQAEFDFAVPQFRLIYHPILLMLAATIGLVTARLRLGRWGALSAVIFYLVVRGILSLLVGPVLGRTTLHFPLYLAEAFLIEGVALALGTQNRLRFALASGVAVGTVGLAAEWGWSHLWMSNPWPAALLSEAWVPVLAAIGGAVIGMLIGSALNKDVGRFSLPRWVPAVAGVLAVGSLVYAAPMSLGDPVTARVTLDRASPDAERAMATVELTPKDAADDALWFHALAWQGLDWERGSSVLAQFEEVERGVYRTEEPIPVSGDWKSLIRLHVDEHVTAVPVYLPEDPAIPAEEVPAHDSFERSFVADKDIVQREAVGGNNTLMRIGYGILLAIGILWIASMGWGLARLTSGAAQPKRKTHGGLATT